MGHIHRLCFRFGSKTVNERL